MKNNRIRNFLYNYLHPLYYLWIVWSKSIYTFGCPIGGTDNSYNNPLNCPTRKNLTTENKSE